MSPGAATLGSEWPRRLRLVRQVAVYELRKATVFRTGFLVREVLRGVSRPLVMVFVYLAMIEGAAADEVGGFSFAEIVQYLVLVATFQKVLFHERALELSDQIFEGYITKYLVMPCSYYSMALGRFIQYTMLQLGVAVGFWLLGAALLPRWWAYPASLAAAAQALLLLLLGSYCFLLVYYTLNAMAFWLDVVWTLLIGFKFVSDFVSGTVVPVSMMPPALAGVFHWTFPYWSLSAPIEIYMGRLHTDAFLNGVGVLGASIVILETTRRAVWSRGVRRYTGSGM